VEPEALRVDLERALDGHVGDLAPLRGSTLTVTGGTGFVGSWLTEAVAYLNDVHGFGTEVVLFARGVAAFEEQRPHLASRPDVRVVAADVRHLVELPKATGWLVHAAANPDTRFHASNPIETMVVIAEGTAAVLRAADRCSDLRLVLNLSSGLVLGPQPLDLEGLPEDQAPTGPVIAAHAAYAEAKRYAETLCLAVRSQARQPIANVRPFAFVGPYQAMATPWALNSFITDALNGGPIRVLGSGRTVRSYLYGADAATWLLRMLVDGEAGRTYNLGSPEAVELKDLASLVAACFERPPDVLFNTQPGAPAPESRLVPDVRVAARLGLDVRIGLRDAVARTVEWNRRRAAIAR
jgi:nucleoside-diphosphate-sugar epimerase